MPTTTDKPTDEENIAAIQKHVDDCRKRESMKSEGVGLGELTRDEHDGIVRKLKPCPFCGCGIGELEINNFDGEWYITCHCGVSIMVAHPLDIDGWNRRCKPGKCDDRKPIPFWLKYPRVPSIKEFLEQ